MITLPTISTISSYLFYFQFMPALPPVEFLIISFLERHLPLTPGSQEAKAYDPIKCITAEKQILSLLLF